MRSAFSRTFSSCLNAQSTECPHFSRPRSLHTVISVGHVCLDFIPTFATPSSTDEYQVFRPGGLLNLDGPLDVSTGGGVNAGVAMRCLSDEHNVIFVASVGRESDALSGIAREMLGEYGDVSFLKSLDAWTSYSVILAPPNQDRTILHYPGSNDLFCSDDVPLSEIESHVTEFFADSTVKGFHFGYPPILERFLEDEGVSLAEMFQNAKSTFPEALVSLDMSLPDVTSDSLAASLDWGSFLDTVLPFVDVFLPSVEEILLMTDLELYSKLDDEALQDSCISILDLISFDQYAHIAEELVCRGVDVVAIKGGHLGAFVRSSSGDGVFVPSFKRDEIVSACGAGDCFVAGFLSGLIRGEDVVQSARIGNCAGYWNLSASDAYSGLPLWNDLLESIGGLELRGKKDFPKSVIKSELGLKWKLDSGCWTCKAQ